MKTSNFLLSLLATSATYVAAAPADPQAVSWARRLQRATGHADRSSNLSFSSQLASKIAVLPETRELCSPATLATGLWRHMASPLAKSSW
ncbi:hypothetical protein GQ53DRAFT_751189 [Thozetella sp. PMI_491]|nr:hypothetical protein GQ53DRAFT_751189 [Thozetella sp. PMI_491]